MRHKIQKVSAYECIIEIEVNVSRETKEYTDTLSIVVNSIIYIKK